MSSFILVVIACITLFIGHIPFAIPDLSIAHGMACVGKLAFPIFAFLVANNYLSNKSNFSKCLTRLIVFALIAQIFSTLLFFGKIKVLYFNIFFTLALGLLALRFIDKLQNRFIAFLIVGIISILAEVLNFDYGAVGILLIVSFSLSYIKPTFRTLLQIALFVALYLEKLYRYIPTLDNIRYLLFQMMFSIIGLLFPVLYRSNKDKKNKYTKLIFYCFYPLHFIVLCVVKLIA